MQGLRKQKDERGRTSDDLQFDMVDDGMAESTPGKGPTFIATLLVGQTLGGERCRARDQ
jgi:hypothetical protein